MGRARLQPCRPEPIKTWALAPEVTRFTSSVPPVPIPNVDVKPRWADGLDPLETLFLGAAWPEYYGDAYRFANACDTWLRVLRGTAYWEGIERFVREAAISAWLQSELEREGEAGTNPRGPNSS